MQDTIKEIEQFVAQVAIGAGLVVAGGAFLLAGWLMKHSDPREPATVPCEGCGLDIYPGAAEGRCKVCYARLERAREVYNDAVALDRQDTLADALRASEASLPPDALESELCPICDSEGPCGCPQGAEFCAGCNGLSNINEDGLCSFCEQRVQDVFDENARRIRERLDAIRKPSEDPTFTEMERRLLKACLAGREPSLPEHQLDSRTHCCTVCSLGPFNEPTVPKDCPGRCAHPRCQPPNGFDESEAKSCDSYEIRRRWPRFFGDCPDCGVGVIGYASRMHYYMGDW